HFEFILNAGADARNKELPNPARAHGSHRIDPSVPVVEISDQCYLASRRRPDGELRPRASLVNDWMSAQNIVDLVVSPFVEKKCVDSSDSGQKGVRVVRKKTIAVIDPIVQTA